MVFYSHKSHYVGTPPCLDCSIDVLVTTSLGDYRSKAQLWRVVTMHRTIINYVW
ncbi:hypothetical protein ES703_06987 [subsurface metagenome]